ncbi:MAG TPA: 3-oxo-tetronate kinase, partial [Afipia sp.]
RDADRWLRAHGADHVMYKICSTFDSTDQVNIGPVLDALSTDAGEAVVLVTPAFPETGRTVYQGHLFVGSVPLNESPLKDHPLNPMRDSNLVRVLARQSSAGVGLADLALIARGPAAIRSKLVEFGAEGIRGVIADAVFERDLESIGAAALGTRVSIGASGLGLGLARGLVTAGQVKRTDASAVPQAAVGGLAACIAGSCSQATLEQIARAEQTMPVLRLAAEQLVAGMAEASHALDWAAARIAKGPVLISSSAAPAEVSRLQALHGREAAGHAIEQSLAAIAEGLVERGVRRLVVAGGETSGAVVDRLRIPAFQLGPEIAPGVPVLRTIGGDRGDMLIALKSGNFGGIDFFADALKLMSR